MNDRRTFFLFALPAIWAIASYAHSYHTGDEHAMYILSCIAGTWIHLLTFFRLAESVRDAPFRLMTTLAGAVPFAIVGVLMDAIRVRIRNWAIIFMAATLLLFAAMIRPYGGMEQAVNKNGSLWAYILSATVLALYASVFLSILVNALARLWKLIHGVANDVTMEVPHDRPQPD